MDYGLGRLVAPDDKDRLHPMRSLISTPPPTRQSRYWYDLRWWGDQGNTSHCVEYSWHHWVDSGPVRPKAAAPHWLPGWVYSEAQTVDEWEGTNYEGTSVRAGAKILQRMGYITEYAWAWDLQTLLDAVLTTGPVVVGTNWYESFFTVNDRGMIEIAGDIAGGHAYLLTGASKTRQLFRIKNSWSRTWGRRGRAYISFDDMQRLLAEEGEACLAVEAK